ncbi:MAG TPA: hypothetical protein VHC50_07765, partial [Puia sp.]|nr:hypothetical protein [Puia sp.]
MVLIASLFCFLHAGVSFNQPSNESISFFEADDRNIQYVGRIDFTNPKRPKFWAPGVYIKTKFKG